jgi:hypothetical protein
MRDVNFMANPTFVLQDTEKGSVAKQGKTLENPITVPNKEAFSDANFDANPAMLKPTDQGSVLREGKEISRPITFPNGKTPFLLENEDPIEQ